MNDANYKEIRKQLRKTTQEILPEILEQGVFDEIYPKLETAIYKKLAQIETEVRDTLTAIDKRSADVQAFIMNEVQAAMAKPPVSPIVEQPTENK